MTTPASEIAILETITLEKAVLEKLGGDVIKIRFEENIDIGLDDIIKQQEPKLRLAGGRPYYLLVISPRFASVSKEAREYSATPAANKGALAKAIVTRSLGMRLIVNFFISINKPPVPHRSFTKEADALAWIEELKAGHKPQFNTGDPN